VRREEQILPAKECEIIDVTLLAGVDFTQERDDQKDFILQWIKASAITCFETELPRQPIDFQLVQPVFEFAGFKSL